MAPDPHTLEPGSEFAGYRIEREIGRGGAVRELRAIGADGLAVRLRVVEPDIARSSEHRGRFEREARVAGSVEHPNLIGVLETGAEDGVPFMVQPNIGEATLAEVLADRGPLEPGEVVQIAAELGGALDALHGEGIVHRDVCAANVVVDSAGGAHLGGMALVKDTKGTNLTEAGTALGSVDYMAPEQIRGEGVGPAADVYALACLAFEALSGRPPFGDRAGMRALWAHLQDEPPRLDGCGGPPSRELDAAIRRGLSKDPEQRPRSAGRFARMLELAHELGD